MANSYYFGPTVDLTEGRHPGEYIKSEGNWSISRDNVVIASGAGVLIPGQVLGKITSSGKFVAHTEAATDGSQNPAGINYAYVDATVSDIPAAITARETEVYGLRLTWDPAVSGTPANLVAAIAALQALGIIVR